MPRPRKPRTCACAQNCGVAFRPAGRPLDTLKRVLLFPDELEALRLCDLKGLTQEQAGREMGVSRGTVQRTVKSARFKVAQALLSPAALVLSEHTEKGD